MNLTSIATLVCQKVRLSDADSITLCKSFLKQRHEMLWNEGLWRESIAQLNVTVDPTTDTLAATGIKLLPASIDKVLAVRTADFALYPEQEESLYQVSPDQYDDTGDPMKFIVMSRVAYQWATAQASVLMYYDDQTEDGGATHAIKYVDSTGKRFDKNEAFDGGDSVGTNIVAIESWAKPASTDHVALWAGAAGSEAVFLTLNPTDTEAPRYLRLRLVNIPTASTALKLLVKRVCPPLEGATESPFIVGSENYLMAMAQYDMLQHQRQYGQANAVLQEGMAMLNQLKDLEVRQQANSYRIVPSEPFDQHVALTAKGYW